MSTARIIMDRVDARVLSSANPCPSREEWEALRVSMTDPSKEIIMREWLGAIRNEITAREKNADLDLIFFYASRALQGDVPHWYTPEYARKVGDA